MFKATAIKTQGKAKVISVPNYSWYLPTTTLINTGLGFGFLVIQDWGVRLARWMAFNALGIVRNYYTGNPWLVWRGTMFALDSAFPFITTMDWDTYHQNVHDTIYDC
jgi:hypothetical protein